MPKKVQYDPGSSDLRNLLQELHSLEEALWRPSLNTSLGDTSLHVVGVFIMASHFVDSGLLTLVLL